MEFKLLLCLKNIKIKNGVERTPCVYFKNHHNSFTCFHFLYMLILNVLQKKISGCQPPPMKKTKDGPVERSYTEKYQKHTACGYGYKVVCHYDEKYSSDVVIYRGEDCIQKIY